jgi:flagellar protein FliS
MTASPCELRLMLFDGAIKFLEQGRNGLQERDYEAAYNGITRCQNIIMELLNSLEPQHAPDLCEKLSGLYTFMYTELVRASTERDPAVADDVLGLLRYERETWVMLMKELETENVSAAEAAGDTIAERPTAGAAEAQAAAADLVGGHVSLKG